MGNQSNYAHGNDPTLHARIIENQRDMAVYQDQQGEQFQKYTVLFDGSYSFDSAYQFRVNNHHSQLVDVLYAAPPQSYIGCVQPGSYQVVTQRIPYRLAHFPPQHAENALTLLQAALRGFKDLFKVHGVMIVKDSMIGVNSKNKVKVWLNPNFAINKPEETPISLRNLQPACHEREIVHNIFDLISSKSEHGAIWKEFASIFEKKNIHTFDAGLAAVDGFIKQKKLKVDGHLRNPFNKPGFDKKSDINTLNSEIDKLEDYKLTHLNEIHNLELKTAIPQVPSTFPELRTTVIHTQVKDLPNQHIQQPIPIPQSNPQIRTVQIEQQSIRVPSIRIAAIHSPPKQIFTTNTSNINKSQLNPQAIERQYQLREANIVETNSIRHSQSQPKKIDVKFKYNHQQSSMQTIPMTKSINLLGVRILENANYASNTVSNAKKPLVIQLQPNTVIPPNKVIQTNNIASPRTTTKEMSIQTIKTQIPSEKVSKQAPQLQKLQSLLNQQHTLNAQKVSEKQQKVIQKPLQIQLQQRQQKPNEPIQKGLQAKSVLSENNPVIKKIGESNSNLLFDHNQVVNSSRQQPSEKGQMRGQVFQQQSYEIKLNQFSRSEVKDDRHQTEFNKLMKRDDQVSFPADRFNKIKQDKYHMKQQVQNNYYTKNEENVSLEIKQAVIETTKLAQSQGPKQDILVSKKDTIKPYSGESINGGFSTQKLTTKIGDSENIRSYGGIGGKLPNLSYRDIRKMLQQTLSKG